MTVDTTASTRQPLGREVMSGLSQALPVIMGYLPIGFAYGVLAQQAGVSAFNTLLMSLVVYAGSSQFIAVGMIAGGASAISIVFTTFVVNLRHMLMATALSPHLKRWHNLELFAFSFHITDETFAVHSMRFASASPTKVESFTINVSSQAAWVLGSGLGIVAGQLVSDVKPLGLDYALPAMFIGLLVLQIKDRVQVLIAIFAGVLSVGLYLAGASQWNVILATLIGATVGMGLEQWTKKSSS